MEGNPTPSTSYSPDNYRENWGNVPAISKPVRAHMTSAPTGAAPTPGSAPH